MNQKKQSNRVFMEKESAIKVIIDCRTTAAIEFRTILGFEPYHVNLTKEQSVLTKTISKFEEKNMQTQYNVLGYKIDLYFHDDKLVIEIDENSPSKKTLNIK